jgi:hypothetical protein
MPLRGVCLAHLPRLGHNRYALVSLKASHASRREVRPTTQRGRRGRGGWHSQGKRRKGHAVLEAWRTSPMALGCDRPDTPRSTAHAAGTPLSSASSTKEMPSLYIAPSPCQMGDGGC